MFQLFFQRPPRNTGGFGGRRADEDEILGLEEEDDIVAADLDMHSLILTSNPQDSAVSSCTQVQFNGSSLRFRLAFCC